MRRTGTNFYRTAVIAAAALLSLAGTSLAAPVQETAPVQEPEVAVTEQQAAVLPEENAAEEPQIRTFGEASEDAVKFEITNKTGKDITYISIRVDDGTDVNAENVKTLQTALIEQGFLDDIADGSYGPKTKAAVKAFREKNGLSAEEKVDEEMLVLLFEDYDDGNILEEDEVIKAEETVIIYYQEEAEEALEEPAVEQEPAGTSPEEEAADIIYTATFRLAEDEETEYVLHYLAAQKENVQIFVVEDTAYIEYQEADSQALVSTQEIEWNIMHPVVPTYNDYNDYDDYGYYDDYYYDDYSDYSYDYYDSYDPYAQENPEQGVDGCIEDGLTW